MIKDLRGKVLDAAKMLNYQSGAVVSKELIRKDTGTVTLFAFDKGQGLSEHTAPFDAFIYIVDGTAQIFICGKPHTVGKNEMIILPAKKPHALKAVKKFKMLLVMIKA